MRQLVVLLKTLFMAVCAIVIFGFITRQLRHLDHYLPVSLPSWTAVVGVFLMVAGAILAFIMFWPVRGKRRVDSRASLS